MGIFPLRWSSWSAPFAAALVASVLGCVAEPSARLPDAAADPRTPGERETWDAIFFGDQKVGYAHTVVEPVLRDGRELLRIAADSELAIQRFAQTTRQRLRYDSLETPEGEVLQFHSSMASGGESEPPTLTASGEAHGNQLRLSLTTPGKTETAVLPWDKRWGGYFALEQSLERTPLPPRERRSLRSLVPGFNQVADIELTARDEETTDTPDGAQKLLRVDCQIKLGSSNLEQTLWIDREGQVIKTYLPALQQATFRTTKERALAASTGTFDLGERSMVKVERALDEPHSTRRIHYRATIGSGDAAGLFLNSATQRITPASARSVDILVRALDPTEPLGQEFSTDDPPEEDDLLPNTLIQSDDQQIRELAGQVAANEESKWEIAVALERQVGRLIRNKGFTQALSSAAEVVRSGEGDCTEHAVLLAALCRARKIPSRVAIGLVYFRPARGFAYHMWTEVWINDRWLPLDATLAQGGIGAAHLAVSRSNLKGVDPLTQFLPVLQLIGNLTLEIVSVE